MNIRVAFGFIGMAILSSCQTSAPSEHKAEAAENTKPYSLTTSESKAVETGVRSVLKDPTSPLFGSMTGRMSDAGVVTVCGLVNAKNSYGGYTGDQPYIGIIGGNGTDKPGFVVAAMGGSETDTKVVQIMCSKFGIVI
jgi:hypothetical protein